MYLQIVFRALSQAKLLYNVGWHLVAVALQELLPIYLFIRKKIMAEEFLGLGGFTCGSYATTIIPFHFTLAKNKKIML